MANSGLPDAKRRQNWVPGEVGIWAFILADMMTFGVFFVVFIYERRLDLDAFAAGSASLSTTFGAVNTFILLTASLFIAQAVQRVRGGRIHGARIFLGGAALAGAAFVVSKVLEWTAKISDGASGRKDTFYQLYFTFTGIHLVHVLIALIIVGYLYRMTNAIEEVPSARQERYFENGASYWHMVDVLWLVLFAVLYLVR